MVIFLIGETPVSGINKEALVRSLDFVEQAIVQKVACGCIKILGPTFSGSQTSLQLALEDWSKRQEGKRLKKRQLEIITGSATAINTDRLITHDLKQKWEDVKFAATVRHEEVL